MKNNILEFDKRKIGLDEIREHVDYYVGTAKKGFEFLKNNDKKEVMVVLKEIRKYMRGEFNYYNKSKVEKYISSNKMYSIYWNGLYQAFVKQNNPTSYHMVSSNLYDIKSYMGNYGMKIFE